MLKASGSQTRVYAVDETGRPLGVYVVDANASNGFRVEEEYVHLDGWRPVAVIRPNPSTGMANPQVFPILSDHLGTPRKVLDGGTGQTRWAWDAKQPFGHEMPLEIPTAGLPAFTLDLRFPGQRFDEEIGLFHNGFRDYHPGLGRYVQSDPLGLEAGWNTYSYVGSNPMNGQDPLGLKNYLWIEGPNYGNTAGAMPSFPTKYTADEKHFEPAGHLSVGIGDPIYAYRSYSFGVNGIYRYGLKGNVYIDSSGGGKILIAYEVTKEQMLSIDRELRSMVDNSERAYGPTYTCRTFTRNTVNEMIKRYGLVPAKNYPIMSSPSASRL